MNDVTGLTATAGKNGTHTTAPYQWAFKVEHVAFVQDKVALLPALHIRSSLVQMADFSGAIKKRSRLRETVKESAV